MQVSPELRRRSMRVAEARPQFRGAVSHFYAFEAFRLAGYRKVLFCDGDLLFRQPVGELFDAKDAMLAWGLDPIPVAAFKLWYDAWMNCLAARRLLAQSGAIFPVTPPDSRRLHPR